MKDITLICIPYAGGSSMIYNSWNSKLMNHIKLLSVELPGRGMRFSEPLIDDFEEALTDLTNTICDNISTTNYAILGYSLGALFAYELSYKLSEALSIMPQHLFLSACPYPQDIVKTNYEDLSKSSLLNLIRSWEGTPDVFFENQELIDCFLPIFSSDLKIYGMYNIEGGRNRLSSNVSVLYGKDDASTTYETVRKWEKVSQGRCDFLEFRGKHMFIIDRENEIVDVINQKLSTLQE